MALATFKLMRISYRLVSITLLVNTGAWDFLVFRFVAVRLFRRVRRVWRRPKPRGLPNGKADIIGRAGARRQRARDRKGISAHGTVSIVEMPQASEPTMTEVEHDRLVEMYLTGWWSKTRDMVIYRFVHRADRLLELVDQVNEFDEELIGRIDAEIGHVITHVMECPWGTH